MGKNKTMYKWKYAPKWANFAATDKDGVSTWFEKEPKMKDNFWKAKKKHKWLNFERTEDIDIGWKDSLEKRPAKD